MRREIFCLNQLGVFLSLCLDGSTKFRNLQKPVMFLHRNLLEKSHNIQNSSHFFRIAENFAIRKFDTPSVQNLLLKSDIKYYFELVKFRYRHTKYHIN